MRHMLRAITLMFIRVNKWTPKAQHQFLECRRLVPCVFLSHLSGSPGHSGAFHGRVTREKIPLGAWVAQSVERPTAAQVMISRFVCPSPTLGSVDRKSVV